MQATSDPVAEALLVAARITEALSDDPTPQALSRFDPVFRVADELPDVEVSDRTGIDSAGTAAMTPPLNVNLATEQELLQAVDALGLSAGGSGAVRQAVLAFVDERSRRELYPQELAAAWSTLAESGAVTAQTVGRLQERFGTTSAFLMIRIRSTFGGEIRLSTDQGSIAPVRIAIRTISATDSAPSFSIIEAR
jgi:hypothetical protein